MASYYFTIFKKLQVFDHVPTSTYHGASPPQNNFDLNNPDMLFLSSNRGALLNTSSADSPIYQVLSARNGGAPPYSPVPVTVGTTTTNWVAMPPQFLPAWTDFQTAPATNKLIDVLGNWINTNKNNDVPHGVRALMPPTITSGLGTSGTLFVCSSATDDGTRPGSVPSNFWATSLIFLTNPTTGVTETPATLAASASYNLVAVVGNRFNAGYGRYLAPGTEPCEAQAWVMVWNAGMGPAVQLPALSNLDPTSTNGIYDIYFLRPGEYDLVGFELDVQVAFDGLVQAVIASGMNLGGLTPEQWLKDRSAGAHLCAKVAIRRQTSDSWPAVSDSPLTNPQIAQKNLVPFDVSLASTTSTPNIVWKNFAVGDPLKMILAGDGRWGQNRLVFQEKLPAGIRLFLSVPRETVKRFFTRAALRGLKRVEDERLHGPYPDGVTFELPREEALIDLNPLRDEMIAMSLGIWYDRRKLKPGHLGELVVTQQTHVPEVTSPKEGRYAMTWRTGGGMSIEFRAHDPNHRPTRKNDEKGKKAPARKKAKHR
ncbi:MAG TPA: hypothetical protein VHE30_25665 [Polyangiaceae bacterium]|nr:hypothetical protein [Polyangiaceae bacterium]